MSDGVSTGNGAGFSQSSNPFGGLNNTDLRGRRRRRVPLLNTSWLIRPRKQEFRMRKSLTGLIDTLSASVKGIADAGVDNRDELLKKSFTEFTAELGKQLGLEYGDDFQPLAKGLNHIASFASALNRLNQVVTAIKTGRPSYMLEGDSSMPPEELPEEIQADLDHFIEVGVLTLRGMVNNSVELPADAADLQRAEKEGRLVKLDFGDDLSVVSDLPQDLHQYITDPLELMSWNADVSQQFLTKAADLAEELLKSGSVPDDVIKAYPEIFVVEDDLGKVFPPPKKKPALADGQAPDDAATGGGSGTDDPEGDDAADQGQGDEPTDLTDDVPQDPLQMIARLGTMIVVMATSISQGAQGEEGGDSTIAGNPDDPNNAGLQRGESLARVPLAKIYRGEVEGEQTLFDVMEELEGLRKMVTVELPALRKHKEDSTRSIALMQETVDRLKNAPAPVKGFAKLLSVRKIEDSVIPGTPSAEDLAAQTVELIKRNPEGDEAAKLLIRQVHNQGSRQAV